MLKSLCHRKSVLRDIFTSWKHSYNLTQPQVLHNNVFFMELIIHWNIPWCTNWCFLLSNVTLQQMRTQHYLVLNFEKLHVGIEELFDVVMGRMGGLGGAVVVVWQSTVLLLNGSPQLSLAWVNCDVIIRWLWLVCLVTCAVLVVTVRVIFATWSQSNLIAYVTFKT